MEGWSVSLVLCQALGEGRCLILLFSLSTGHGEWNFRHHKTRRAQTTRGLYLGSKCFFCDELTHCCSAGVEKVELSQVRIENFQSGKYLRAVCHLD